MPAVPRWQCSVWPGVVPLPWNWQRKPIRLPPPWDRVLRLRWYSVPRYSGQRRQGRSDRIGRRGRWRRLAAVECSGWHSSGPVWIQKKTRSRRWPGIWGVGMVLLLAVPEGLRERCLAWCHSSCMVENVVLSSVAFCFVIWSRIFAADLAFMAPRRSAASCGSSPEIASAAF